MGMSVALDIEARQAAAVKAAEEQALVRKAQAETAWLLRDWCGASIAKFCGWR